MGHPLLKDIADIQYKQPFEGSRIFNWKDWVKRENPEELILGYIEVSLQHVLERINAIETHIANPSGRAFVRSSDRPQVGAEVLQQIAEPLRLLNQRLDKIEGQLSGGGSRQFDGATGGASGERSQ
jgi:predicted mannosyl-3-phosphoglycerate phosphatase (HAD superfamily)